MRAFVSLFFLVSIAGSAVAAQPIDLKAPGALESLRAENPSRYAKVRSILAAAEAYPSSEIDKWLRTDFDASDIQYAPLWHVSDPPKMRLSFALEGTRYTAVVVGRFPAPQFIPAR
jgi:hypothetical protein